MSAISGWTVVITPKFNTSKMLVTVNISLECRSANMLGVELTRNGTAMFNNKGGFRGDNANGGITGSNYNITGVNQITMNDPGEGIVFKSGIGQESPLKSNSMSDGMFIEQ